MAFLLVFLLSFIVAAQPSWAKKITYTLEAVEVAGNVYFNADDIIGDIGKLDLWEGDDLTVDELDGKLYSDKVTEEKAKLIDSGYFTKVEARLEKVGEKGIKVVFTVKENPRFTKLVLEGDNQIPKEKIESFFSFSPGVPVSTKEIAKAGELVSSAYKKIGQDGGIESFQIKETGDVVVTIAVATIVAIRIEGNALIPESDVRFMLLTKEGEIWDKATVEGDKKRLMETGWFREVKVEEEYGEEKKYDVTVVITLTEEWKKVLTGVKITGLIHLTEDLFLPLIDLDVGKPIDPLKIKEIEAAMEATGLLRKVGVKFENYLDGTKIIFEVKENPFVQKIAFKGVTLFQANFLKKKMHTKEKQVLNAILLQNDLRRIEKIYFDQGYIVTRIYDDAIDLDEAGEGKLTLFVGEGKVEKIVIEGEKEEQVVSEEGKTERKIVPAKLRTKPYVVLREMETRPGRILNIKVLQKDLQKIFNLGFFEDIRWEPKPGSSEDTVVVAVKLKEKKTLGTAIFGAGFSSQFGLSGTASLKRDNLFGRGRSISVSLSFGGLTSYEVRYFEPWADRHHTSLDLQAFNTVVPKDVLDPTTNQTSSYDESRKGFSFLLGRPLSRDTTLALGYEFKSVSSKLVSGNAVTGVITSGKVGALRARLTTDSRDNRFAATGGVFNEISLKLSGTFLGADTPFYRTNLDFRRYKKIVGETVLAGRLLAGYYHGNKTLFEETFFVGGSETIRGYQENRFWGTRMVVMNLEWRFPLSGAQGITGVLFADSGYAWAPQTQLSFSDLKTGLGAGIRYTLPFGPIRIDIGYGLATKDTQFYLSFGHLF